MSAAPQDERAQDAPRGDDAIAAALLRGASPTPGRDEDQVIAAAMLAGAARHRRRERARALTWVSGLAAAAACLAVALSWPQDSLSRFQLESGDVLTGVGGARFRALAGDERDRVVALDEGAMLFEVQPLGANESFEVRTSDCVVRVRGTIFSVGTGAQGTRVEVFEGHVEVRREGARVESLRAGDSSGPELAELARLRAPGLHAARARVAAAPATSAAATLASSEAELDPPQDSDSSGGDEGSASIEAASSSPAPARAALDVDVGARDQESAQPARLGARPRRTASEDRVPGAAELRALIGSGEAERALTLALAQLRDAEDPELRFVSADALRALRRYDEAASAYERAASQLSGTRRVQAGYLAAQLHLDHLHQGASALAALDEAGASDEGSPLRERALLLRARALRSMGREAEVTEVGALYLSLYPSGSGVAFFRAP